MSSYDVLGFKTMLQAGIDLADLEVSYISSSSWYLINYTGNNHSWVSSLMS